MDNFKIEFFTDNGNEIARTNPDGRSFAYSSFPGELKLNKWPGTNE